MIKFPEIKLQYNLPVDFAIYSIEWDLYNQATKDKELKYIIEDVKRSWLNFKIAMTVFCYNHFLY